MKKFNLKKSVLMRFIRAFLAGAFGTMITVVPLSSQSWTELGTWLSALMLAAIIGGVSGIILAGDKLYRSVE
mgnify:CR=1 FL=1